MAVCFPLAFGRIGKAVQSTPGHTRYTITESISSSRALPIDPRAIVKKRCYGQVFVATIRQNGRRYRQPVRGVWRRVPLRSWLRNSRIQKRTVKLTGKCRAIHCLYYHANP